MLAVVFGILSFFHSPDFSENRKKITFPAADTIKLPTKLQVNADSSGYLEISRIFITGNKVTHDGIILRELSFTPGDVVKSSELRLILDRDQKKLFNTRLFHTATIRQLDLEPGKIDLLVDVNERWYTFPSPRFDLADRNFNEWWQTYDHDFKRIVYGLKLYQYNMRGRNETLILKALFGFQRDFALTYRIPYIDRKKKQGLIINFEFMETKNPAYKTEDHKLKYKHASDFIKISRSAGLTYTYRNSFYQSHLLEMEYYSNWINDTIYNLNRNYFGEGKTRQKFGTLRYQFNTDHRDVIAYPLAGYQGIFSIKKTGLGLGDDIDLLEVSLGFSRFIDLKKGYYFSNYTNVYWSSPRHQPYANYGALGYKKEFVKGYEVYVIEGPSYFLNKSTFKKRIFSKRYDWDLMPKGFQYIPLSIYLKTYADFGYVNNYPAYRTQHINTRLADTWLAGAGAGVDILISYDIVLRFEYTFNALGSNGFVFNVKKEF